MTYKELYDMLEKLDKEEYDYDIIGTYSDLLTSQSNVQWDEGNMRLSNNLFFKHSILEYVAAALEIDNHLASEQDRQQALLTLIDDLQHNVLEFTNGTSKNKDRPFIGD